MTIERAEYWAESSALFDRLADVPAEGRASLLNRCDARPEVKTRVKAMFDALDSAPGFLDRRAGRKRAVVAGIDGCLLLQRRRPVEKPGGAVECVEHRLDPGFHLRPCIAAIEQ